MSGERLSYYERARLMMDSPALTTSSEVLVALALSDYSDGGERAVWPGFLTLAKRTRLSRRTVQRIVGGLVRRGILTEERRIGRSTRYRFVWCALSPATAVISRRPIGDEARPTSDTPSGVGMSTHDTVTGEGRSVVAPSPVIGSGGCVIMATDRFRNEKEDRNIEASSARAPGEEEDLSFLDSALIGGCDALDA